jgi:hypothetical protein
MEQNVQRRIRQAEETSSPAASPGRLRVVPRDHNPFIDFGSRETQRRPPQHRPAQQRSLAGARRGRRTAAREEDVVCCRQFGDFNV